MKQRRANIGFTLIELLVVIAIIALLTSILLPSLSAAKQLARSTVCLNNLYNCGVAMQLYHAEYEDRFWPVSPYKQPDHPQVDKRWFWWGTDSDPVDPSVSGFMNLLEDNLAALACPEFRYQDDYMPQGVNVYEPTTSYGYNAYYLDPLPLGRNCKSVLDIPKPSELFVLADAAMDYSSMGAKVIKNSTYLEWLTGDMVWVQTPTNHFRHRDKTNALCADGHAQTYGPEGWTVNDKELGFVGVENEPHYEQ